MVLQRPTSFVAVVVFMVIVSTPLLLAESQVEKKCHACKDIIKNFKKGLDSTVRHNYGGGNTDWEESRLGSYANSETRLVEIIEGLCPSTSKESLCHGIVEEHEEDIEHWWFKKRADNPDLQVYLCISLMKVCCPKNTFGPDCKECPGDSELPCSDHGVCQGSGTRGGSGECDCHTGYQGALCDDCQQNFYENNSTCEDCHESCKSACSGAGPKGCDDCDEGWMKTDDGCVDVNECDDSPCETGKYCVNNQGSHRCVDCDTACADGCTGAGSSSCKGCKDGYLFEENQGCKDVNECVDGDKCDPGSYCRNKRGSYDCQMCHESCELECTGPKPGDCKSCKTGYEMVDGEGCKDIDECVVDKVMCGDGKYCKNQPGRHTCDDCDRSCTLCFAPGPEGCSKCANGYQKKEQRCQDINECKDKPCHSTEKCINLNGSHRCDCKDGYTRKDGLCSKDETKKDDDDNEDDDNDDDPHEEL